MFYSSTPSLINDNSSYLHSKHVFAGQYWDEFGITGYLIPENARVLMLGLSSGGGVRPLLAADKNIDLSCVDLDKAAVGRCTSFYRHHFPGLRFTALADEAQNFLDHSSATYDCIWLDLYNKESYSDLYFSDVFYHALKSRLGPKGILLVNAYGLPNQFSPLTRGGVQTQTAQALVRHFPFLYALPYRRNLTFIAAGEAPHIYPCAPRSELSVLDQSAFRCLDLRVRHLQQVQNLSAAKPGGRDSRRFAHLDEVMRGLWSEILTELSGYGIHLHRTTDLLSLVQNAALAGPSLELAMHARSPWLKALPILCAGESHLHELDVNWIFPWLSENAATLKRADRESYIQVWLPQLWSMVIQPEGRFKRHYFRMLGLIQREFA